MKLVHKEDLIQVDKYLVDPAGNVLGLHKLADEFNEVMEIANLVAFVRDNAPAIEASDTEPVVYTPVKETEHRLTPVPDAPTPLKDKTTAEAKAVALEFLAHQETEDINNHLLRYRALAKWFNEDVIIVAAEPGKPSKFNGDILELTEAEVVDIVSEYHDPEVARLHKKLRIDFS